MSRIIVICFTLCTIALQAEAGDIARYLKKADSYRLEADSMQVETEVKLFKSGALDKERRYTVYLKSGRRSLVLMQSAGEKGQKVLMLGDDFWQIMPQSQRPIRITPMQKLLGDASVGDIATMSWSEDYDGTAAGEVDLDGIPCLHLSLVAKNKGVSYKRIELFIAKSDSRPVKADLYVASDKLAKQARFTVASAKGRLQVTAMAIKDQIQTGRETVINYLSRKVRSVPDEYFNPMFLTRNDLKE
ncbi:MAG: outer membrane lipoprotein-sorting protein [Desulfuromonadales bacterium]